MPLTPGSQALLDKPTPVASAVAAHSLSLTLGHRLQLVAVMILGLATTTDNSTNRPSSVQPV